MADERPSEISWLLQVQFKPGEPWHDHTSSLFRPEDAKALRDERQAANPNLRYRLVRVTTRYTVDRDPQ